MPLQHVSSGHTTDFVLLRADNVRLLVPQYQLGHTEYLTEKLSICEGTDGMGLFCVMDNINGYIYMAISEQLRILTTPPIDRAVVTPIQASDGGQIRWCWNEVHSVKRQSIHLQPLLPCMITPHTPVTHFAELEDGHLAFLGDANSLLQYALAQAGTLA